MDDRTQNLFSELEQICEQYKEQVPGKRRAWPKAVRERVEELEHLGINGYEISRRIPVPYMTIVSWRSKTKKEKSGFLPVAVVDKKQRPTTVTVKRLGHIESDSIAGLSNSVPTTVTVVTPEGFRIEGLPVEFAKPLLSGGAR